MNIIYVCIIHFSALQYLPRTLLTFMSFFSVFYLEFFTIDQIFIVTSHFFTRLMSSKYHIKIACSISLTKGLWRQFVTHHRLWIMFKLIIRKTSLKVLSTDGVETDVELFGKGPILGIALRPDVWRYMMFEASLSPALFLDLDLTW